MRFCSPGTNLVEHYECRGTKLVANHIFIPGYKFCCELWRGRGINSYKSVLAAGAKAKTMTSNLPLLSVLCGRSNFILVMQEICLLLIV
jgi:hypothetical protein